MSELLEDNGMFLSEGTSFGYVFPLALGDGGGTKFLVQATQGEVTPCHHSTSVGFCFFFWNAFSHSQPCTTQTLITNPVARFLPLVKALSSSRAAAAFLT